MNACDPDADIENLRKLIKINAGVDIKLTKKEICEAYQDIQDGKLPLPPLVMNSTRTYLVDKKSPLKPNDYELLFDSTTKRVDLKRVARKVNLKNVEQMTKSQIVDAIGKRLRYMKVHEPVKFARKRRVSVNTNTNTAVNNTAVSNVNNANFNINRVNTNVNLVNTNVNRVNTNLVNTNVNTNMNRVNMNRVNTNMNRVNTNVNRPKERNSKVTFPTGGLFAKGGQPKFLGGTRSAVKSVKSEKKGFFAGLFGKKENKNFVAANKFKGSKEGYVFRKGEKGLGYYLNTGLVQGPQLPPINNTKPIPANEDFALELAVARVKQLGLKREQKFLNQIQLGKGKRKNIVVQAEAAKEEENQFASFLDSLNISNTNKNAFKRRMATDDFKQIQIEAQLKADEKANVVRSNEEKMIMFLKTTGLNNTNKTLFLNRARANGSNINALIEEARQLNTQKKTEKLSKKQDEFRTILQNYNKLNAADKEALIKSVTDNVNANTMRKMADDLLQKRIEEKKNATAQNLLSFLTPLQINQSNKNQLLRRFRNEGANINSIKAEALKLQEAKGSANIEKLRVQLETRLDELGLNQVNKNSIMRKFTNGNRNVNSLIQEAKNIKSTRNAENMNAKRKEYASFLNTLPGLTNDDKRSLLSSNNRNRNKAKTLSNQRVANQKANEKAQFEKFLVNLGLNNGDRRTMLNKYNSNTLTVNALQKVAQELKSERVQQQKAANKKTLMEYLETANVSRNTKINIERRFNANQANLRTLQLEVNKMIKNAQNAKLANNKAKLASNVKGSILSNTNKNAFIRRLNSENANITTLRSELNAMVTKIIQTQRGKDRDELEEYMKTQGLSPENQKVVLNKFNVNSNISLTNLKQEANAILASRIQQKRNANVGVLTNHGRKLGLNNQEIKNLTNKLNREKLEPLMNEANAIAKKKAQNEKNALNREKSNYINKLGLNANNKRNILAQNLNFNATKELANKTLQNKIAEKRSKNMIKLGLHLNQLSLNNGEKQKFFNNFNKNVNLNTIMKNASNFDAKKKVGIKTEQLANLKKFMNQQGLNAGEQKPFINKLNKNQDDLAALKIEAKKVADQKFANLKAKKRGELVNVLKGLSNLTQNDINGILKNFDNTNTNSKVLSNRAKEINKSRKDEKYAQDEIEFYNYLNTLQNLTPENKTEITSKLNGYFTNWNSIKQLATNTAVGRAKERRAAEKADLNNYMSNMGFNNNSKRIFFKNLDDGKNLKMVKKDAVAYKKDLNAKRKATARKGFSNLLDTLYLNQPDRNALLEQFNDETTGLNQLKNNAREREAKTIDRNRGALTLYLSDELKLNTPDVNLLLKNYNADPGSLNTLRNRGRQLKNARNEEERKEIRRQIREYLNGLNLLNNKNKQNIINKNLSYNNAKTEGNKAQEFKRIAKRGAERNTLTNAIKNLPNSDQKELLNKFNTRNVTLNSVLSEAKDLKAKRIAEKRARERIELYNTLNGLNMNVADRNTIMNKFNKSNATVNSLRNEAVKLRNQRIAQKRAQNRGELEAILNGTNLNASNKTSILNKFNANKNATLTSLRATIEELSKQRRIEKRLAARVEVEKYLKKVGLSNANAQTVLNKFNADNSISLKDASNEANAILIQRVTEKMAQNRENLVQHMNGLNISNANRAAILKNFDSEAASLNNLKNRATQINNAIKPRLRNAKSFPIILIIWV
ncbi:viral A-type inclusion protein [Ostreococcus lucimarinus virus OlV6]|nr:viral A-type inclusion protein [Ostreococcus lucimarinus virus OlV6]